MKFTKLPSILLACVASLSSITYVFAASNYVSLGSASLDIAPQLEAKVPLIDISKFSASGIGGTWLSFADKSNWGSMLGINYISDTHDALIPVKVTYLDLSLGVAYRPTNAQWLRIYPFIGVSSIDREACISGLGCNEQREPYFAYGIGMQTSIPTTNFFVDVNYKKVNTNIDTEVTYLGLGYKF